MRGMTARQRAATLAALTEIETSTIKSWQMSVPPETFEAWPDGWTALYGALVNQMVSLTAQGHGTTGRTMADVGYVAALAALPDTALLYLVMATTGRNPIEGLPDDPVDGTMPV